MCHYEHMHKCMHTHRNNLMFYYLLCILDLCIYFAVKRVENTHVNENITFVYYIMRLYAVCCEAGAADIHR